MATRFEGLPADKNLARQMMDRLRPRINHFHLVQAQKRTVSGLSVYKARQQAPGLEMSYAYIHGQETLRIKVKPLVGDKPQVQEGDYWKWALIDVHVPDAWADSADGVVAKTYRRSPAPNEAEQKFEGFAYSEGRTLFPDPSTYYSDGMDPFVISYAPPGETTVNGDGNQICSLLVDMQRIPKAAVTLDLYMQLKIAGGFQEVVYGYQRTNPQATMVVTHVGNVPVGDTAGFQALYPYPHQALRFTNLGFEISIGNTFSSPMIAYVDPDEPITFPNQVHMPAPVAQVFDLGSSTATQIDPVYHSPSGLLQQVSEYSMQRSFGLDGTGSGDPEDVYLTSQVRTWDIAELTRLEFVEPAPQERNFDVRGIAGTIPLPWATVTHNDEDDFYTWVPEVELPGPVDTISMGGGVIESDVDAVDLDGMTRIGTVTIFPVQKTMSFTPFEQ